MKNDRPMGSLCWGSTFEQSWRCIHSFISKHHSLLWLCSSVLVIYELILHFYMMLYILISE